jgi:hypothetical protein
VFQLVLIMGKRAKYIVSSLLSALGFYLLITLPYESHYYGLLAGTILIAVCFWFGLGIIFDKDWFTKMMAVILPICFFVGSGLFVALLPLGALGSLVLSIIFGIISYFVFLVENVFLVAIGYKTVPLYRAAYTVSLIILLLTSFLLFNSILSFRFNYGINMLLVFLISILVFLYQFWAIAIELPDDGKGKNIVVYVLVPALLVSQLSLAFSFWPVGIFKGSIYLVSSIYVLSGLLQADIRDRLFRKTWLSSVWIGVAILLGIVIMTSWK